MVVADVRDHAPKLEVGHYQTFLERRDPTRAVLTGRNQQVLITIARIMRKREPQYANVRNNDLVEKFYCEKEFTQFLSNFHSAMESWSHMQKVVHSKQILTSVDGADLKTFTNETKKREREERKIMKTARHGTATDFPITPTSSSSTGSDSKDEYKPTLLSAVDVPSLTPNVPINIFVSPKVEYSQSSRSWCWSNF
ncbi:hypothetical protein FQA39_LY08380 [Lamprigera yunnana]|nr:hypothetical protein FQA39_LY08380 [Lamprigera yunnana]